MSKEKVCLVWATPSGKVKRTRFHKPGSRTFILSRKRAALSYKAKEMTKSEWEEAYGKVDPERKPPAANYDIRFEEPTLAMKMWQHKNKHVYRNSVF